MLGLNGFLGCDLKAKPTSRKRKPRRLLVETLETRSVLTAAAPFESFAVTTDSAAIDHTAQYVSNSSVDFSLAPASSAIATKMVNFLEQSLGKRVGGGECAHVATEALRVSGGQFLRSKADYPNSGDYVWGTFVKRIEFKGGKAVDSHLAARVQPGDIIQYRNATFSNGKRASHHTSVVASVDSSGRPTQVFEQNIGKLGKTGSLQDRTVRKSTIDLKTLNGGWVRIYRPIAKTATAGRYEFSIVNNTNVSQQVKQYIGNKQILSSISLGKADTVNSYSTRRITTSSSVKPTLVLNGTSYSISDGPGFEIYSTTSGPRLRILASPRAAKTAEDVYFSELAETDRSTESGREVKSTAAEVSSVTSHLTNGVLTIRGSKYPDRVTVTVSGSNLVVGGVTEDPIETLPGGVEVGGGSSTRASYASKNVARIVITTEGGDDMIDVSTSIIKPTNIYGGLGNDTILGGSGVDVVYGGAGKDTIYGRGGDDVIYGGEGSDTLNGGSGKNSVYEGSSNRTHSMNTMEREVLRLTNLERTKRGLPALKADSQLAMASRLHSSNMATRSGAIGNSQAHNHVLMGVKEPTPSTRIDAVGFVWRARAENIAYGQRSAAEVVNGWMNSEGHRRNILNPAYTHLGVSAVANSRGTLFFTQVFAS